MELVRGLGLCYHDMGVCIYICRVNDRIPLQWQLNISF